MATHPTGEERRRLANDSVERTLDSEMRHAPASRRLQKRAPSARALSFPAKGRCVRKSSGSAVLGCPQVLTRFTMRWPRLECYAAYKSMPSSLLAGVTLTILFVMLKALLTAIRCVLQASNSSSSGLEGVA